MENTTKSESPSSERCPDPILPKPGQRNVLITSALPYVNNVPHLGNIVGSVLSADCFSRYCKLRGLNTLFICGTDEYGTATETKALQEGLTPAEICTKYNKIHKEIYDWFDIKFDKFGRTSTPEQTAVAQDIFLRIYENGYLFEDTMQQLFCEKCDKFLADRFVEGTCPLCGFNDARGDQCDSCGKLIDAVNLIQPRCKVDGTSPVIRSTKHLYLDLPKLQPILEKWVEKSSVEGQWSQNAIYITKAWLKEGLKPRCITRDLKWGTPVPLPEYSSKVFYVWFDAPIGYISITNTYTDDWEQWWKNPQQVQLYQFMGKDNIPFHTVVFPASLLATGYNWTMLHHVSTTEYLNYEGGKFSKSRNTGVFGTDCVTTGIPSEVWRYYLLSNRPESSDSSFSWDDLMDKTNNELIANLGNFVNRALSFTQKEFNSIVPEAKLNEEDQKFISFVNEELGRYIQELDKVHLKEGLKIAMKISGEGNKYLQDNKPWVLIKTDKERCGTVIAVSLNVVKLLASLLEPYMPAFSRKVLQQLDLTQSPIPDVFTLTIPPNHKIGTPAILFQKLLPEKVAAFKEKFGGSAPKPPTDLFPADLRGGVITTVQDHPNDPELFVVKVDLGGEQRQVVARLKSVYTANDLQGRNVVVLCNLPPADLKGVQSEGMMLVAETKKTKDKPAVVSLLRPNPNNGPWAGTTIYADKASNTPPPALTLKEFQKLDLKLNKSEVVFKGQFPLRANNGTEVSITADNIEGSAKIK